MRRAAAKTLAMCWNVSNGRRVTRRPKPQPKRPRFEDCPLANDGVGGNSSDIVLGDGAGASAINVSDVANAQQHETYNSYSDLELKLVLVERDKDISKLKSIVKALKETT